MELRNSGCASEVTLTDEERALLGVAAKPLAAAAIGEVWRAALVQNARRQRTAESAITPPTVLLTPLGAITCPSAAYRDYQELKRSEGQLWDLAHAVLAIEMETLGENGDPL